MQLKRDRRPAVMKNQRCTSGPAARAVTQNSTTHPIGTKSPPCTPAAWGAPIPAHSSANSGGGDAAPPPEHTPTQNLPPPTVRPPARQSRLGAMADRSNPQELTMHHHINRKLGRTTGPPTPHRRGSPQAGEWTVFGPSNEARRPQQIKHRGATRRSHRDPRNTRPGALSRPARAPLGLAPRPLNGPRGHEHSWVRSPSLASVRSIAGTSDPSAADANHAGSSTQM